MPGQELKARQQFVGQADEVADALALQTEVQRHVRLVVVQRGEVADHVEQPEEPEGLGLRHELGRSLDLADQPHPVLQVRHALVDVDQAAEAHRGFRVRPDVLGGEVLDVPRDPRVQDLRPLEVGVGGLHMRYDLLHFLPDQPLVQVHVRELLQPERRTAQEKLAFGRGLFLPEHQQEQLCY